MVVDSQTVTPADRVFHALADKTRRDILTLVLGQEYSVSQIARRYPMSFAAVQKHVAVLEGAALVTKRRQGREQRVTGNPDALQEVRRLLDRLETVWRQRIEAIGVILAEPEPPSNPEDHPNSHPNSHPESHPHNHVENHPEGDFR